MPARGRYLVLARRTYPEALAYHGTLDAAAGEDPTVLARGQFGAEWLEMVLAPEPAVHWVIQPHAREAAG